MAAMHLHEQSISAFYDVAPGCSNTLRRPTCMPHLKPQSASLKPFPYSTAALPHASAAVQSREEVMIASGMWRKPIFDEMRTEVVLTVCGLHRCEAQRAHDAPAAPQRKQCARHVSKPGAWHAFINEKLGETCKAPLRHLRALVAEQILQVFSTGGEGV